MCIQPEFSTDKEVKVRLPHRCTECRRVILPGQRARYIAGKWDGAFDSFYFCLDCMQLRTEYLGRVGDGCEMPNFGELRGSLEVSEENQDLLERFDAISGRAQEVKP